MSLTNKSPSETYKDLLYVDNSNSGVDSTKRSIKSGSGTSSSLSLNDRGALIKSATDNTTAFDVQNSGGTSKLLVDTTNNYVKANGVHVNTQYTYFGTNYTTSSNYAAGYHYPLFVHHQYAFDGLELSPLNLGNGEDPATTLAISNLSMTRLFYMWYVPDAITIDAVTSLEGADAATGDTTRFHLMEYDFTSGSTGGMTNGSLVAHSSDQSNSGYEQIYVNTWTIDSANISAGKVILATFESDSVNSDYTLQVICKYHLTG